MSINKNALWDFISSMFKKNNIFYLKNKTLKFLILYEECWPDIFWCHTEFVKTEVIHKDKNEAHTVLERL